MALTEAERMELAELEAEEAQVSTGGLTAAEAAELAELEAEEAGQSQAVDSGRPLQAGVDAFGRSATFGFLPQIQAGVETAIEEGAGALGFGPLAENERLREQGFDVQDPTFSERSQQFAQRSQALDEENPVASGVGTVAGFVAPGAVGAGLAARGAQAATRLARAAQGAKGAAAVGAAQGLADTPLEAQLEGDLLDIEGRAARGATGAVLGPVGVGAARVLANAPKRLLSVFGGVRKDVIDKYLSNPQAIRDAEEIGREGVEQIILDTVAPIKQALDSATIDQRTAKQLLGEIDKDLVTQFKRERNSAKDALMRAERRLNESFRRSQEDLRRIPPPTELSDNVAQSIEALKSNVIEGSEKASNAIARNLQERVDVSTAYDAIDNEVEKLFIADGRVAPGMQGLVDQLQSLKGEFGELGTELNGKEIKRLIKNLDRQTEFLDVAGSFDDPRNIALKRVRFELDDILKADPEYNAIMEQVRNDAQLLTRARKAFGKPERRLAKLRQIDREANVLDREVLNLLGRRTGVDYSGEVQKFLDIKRQINNLKLDSKKKEYIEALPEFQDVEDARRALDEVDFLDQADLQQKVLADTRRQQANEAAEEATRRLDQQKELADSIKGFMNASPDSKINQLNRVLSSGTPQGLKIREEFQKLSAMTDKDLIELVDNLRVGQVFSSDSTRGSRNVNLWAGMGMLSNLILTGDPFAGAAGAGIGGMVGATIDKVGPTATRKILDWVSNSKGLMTRFKIENAPLDGPTKQELLTMFDQAVLRGIAGTEIIQVLPEDIPRTRQEIMNRPDLSNSEKAKMVSGLNESGEIKDPSKFMGRPATVERNRRGRADQ